MCVHDFVFNYSRGCSLHGQPGWGPTAFHVLRGQVLPFPMTTLLTIFGFSDTEQRKAMPSQSLDTPMDTRQDLGSQRHVLPADA